MSQKTLIETPYGSNTLHPIGSNFTPILPHGMHVSCAMCPDQGNSSTIKGLLTPNTLFSQGPHWFTSTTPSTSSDEDRIGYKNRNLNWQQCALFILSFIEKPVVLWCLTCLFSHLGHNPIGVICSKLFFFFCKYMCSDSSVIIY